MLKLSSRFRVRSIRPTRSYSSVQPPSEEELATLEKSLDAVETRSANLKQEIETLQTKMRSTKQEIETLQAQVQAYEKKAKSKGMPLLLYFFLTFSTTKEQIALYLRPHHCCQLLLGLYFPK